ncbi:hypothetical protein Tco_0799740 [Tanacetum coccineum]|uniref:Uncharacterized protein n=1 Tax=Tanacetum coccineum TaxID=301880 RepID=A0ABQ4ZV14_9ASTR
MFAVCACARFLVTPKTSHFLAVMRIFRYLKGKPTLGLWYSRDSPFELIGYTDSDYAGATQDRKSTTRDYLLTKGFDAGRFQYLVSSKLKRGQDTKIPQSGGSPEKVTAAELLTTVRHHLVLSVQVNAVEEQFWQTAALSINEDGVRGITATIDRKVKVFVSEASIRRPLKLEDSEGLKTLPTAEIFKQLLSLGICNSLLIAITFKRDHVPLQWKFFISFTFSKFKSPKKICLGAVSSSNIATSIHSLTIDPLQLEEDKVFENVRTYTRRRKDVSTGYVVEVKGNALCNESEPPKEINKRVPFNSWILAKAVDEREEVAAKVDQLIILIECPAVLRISYTFNNQTFLFAEVRKKHVLYLKESRAPGGQCGYGENGRASWGLKEFCNGFCMGRGSSGVGGGVGGGTNGLGMEEMRWE